MHHIILVELNFVQNESDKRTDILCFKTVYQTVPKYKYILYRKYVKIIPWAKTTQKATDSSNGKNKGENRNHVAAVIKKNLIDLALSLIKKERHLKHTL